MFETVVRDASRLAQWQAACFFYLGYMVIASYWITVIVSNNQLIVSYKQTSKSLPGVNPPTGVKITTPQMQYMQDNSSMLTLFPLFHV